MRNLEVWYTRAEIQKELAAPLHVGGKMEALTGRSPGTPARQHAGRLEAPR